MDIGFSSIYFSLLWTVPKSDSSVCTWHHGSHVGDHEQKHFYLLGTKLHFHRIKVKKTTAKTDQPTWKRLRYAKSTGQHQSSSGLLGKTTNVQNIYYCNIINGSYMVWRGKVWLLRKINRKKDKDYIMIILIHHVCSFRFRYQQDHLVTWPQNQGLLTQGDNNV